MTQTDNIIDSIALSMTPGVTPARAISLISMFGSATGVFDAASSLDPAQFSLAKETMESLTSRNCHGRAGKEIEFCEKYKIHILTPESEDYPLLLKECPDYPQVLYVKGERSVLNQRNLSVAGPRRVSGYGEMITKNVTAELCRMFPDINIVGGLSLGIDSLCHNGAVKTGVATTAFLVNSLKKIYPSQNRRLAIRILDAGGALVSEYYSDQPADKDVVFRQRNRLIAGMSLGTVLFEAPEQSGSLSTAHYAFNYNRELMAFPGRATDPHSAGANRLIRHNRASLVTCAEDIADILNWNYMAVPEVVANNPEITPGARLLLDAMERGTHYSMSDIRELCGETAELQTYLLELEMEGMVSHLPGNIFERLV